MSALEKDQEQSMVFIDDASLTIERAQQLKLMSLGRLSASIAHEIRNPLAAISHAAQLMEEAPERNQEEKRCLQIILSQSQRINNIIREVLSLSRRQGGESQYLDLGYFVDHFIKEYHPSAVRPLKIDWEKPEKPIHGYFNPTHLRQILTNLF